MALDGSKLISAILGDADYSQGQDLGYVTKEWTETLGSSSYDYGNASIAVATDGSIFIIDTTDDDAGQEKIFLKKYYDDGSIAWSQILGSYSNDVETSVSTASDGSVYVTGFKGGSQDNQSNTSEEKAYLNKYNSDGSIAWSQILGSYSNDVATSVSTAVDGSVYIAGFAGGKQDAQPIDGNYEAFLSKYNSDGSKAWTQLLGLFSDDDYTVSAASDGSVYIAGFTDSSQDEQSINSDYEAFLSKYNSDGSKAWTQLLGSTSEDYSHSISSAANGSVFITGFIGDDPEGDTQADGWVAFLSKYNSNGSKEWIQLLGSSNEDEAYSISAAVDGSVYIAGRIEYDSEDEIDDIQDDAFLSKYDIDGSKVWTQLLGPSSYEEDFSVASTSEGSVYIAGKSEGTSDDQWLGNEQAFLSKYTDNVYDTIPPTISVVINDGKDGFLNAVEASSVSIFGTTTGVEDGQIVSVTITSDGGGAPISATATVVSNSYSTSGLDLSSLGGCTINIAADVEDIAGNSATQALASSNKIFYPVKKSKKNATLGENENKLVLKGVKNINGTGGNIGDLIIGNKGKNVLKGLLGNDTLMGGLGNDKLQGGGGHDVLKGGSGKDVLKGGWGKDILNGGNGKDKLKGGSGADTFMASKGTDTIYGFSIQEGDLLSGFGDTSGLDISDSAKFCIVSGNGYTARLKGVDAVDLIAAMESVFV